MVEARSQRSLRRCLKTMSGERVVRELTSSGGWAGQYATG